MTTQTQHTFLFNLQWQAEVSESARGSRHAKVEIKLESPQTQHICLQRALCLLLQDVSRPEEFQYAAIYQVCQS